MLSYYLFFYVHSYHILVQPFLTLDTIARWYQSGVRSWKLKNQYHCSITPSQPKNTKKPKMSFSDDEIGNNMNQNQNNSSTITDELTLQIANMFRNGLGI